MGEAKKLGFDDPSPILDDEDEETLAAIDEGIRDAEAGRTVSIDEVRKLLPQWITASSSRNGRYTIWPRSSAVMPEPTAKRLLTLARLCSIMWTCSIASRAIVQIRSRCHFSNSEQCSRGAAA
jgi:hypothetical protein